MAQLALGIAGAAVLGPAGFGLVTAGTGWLIGSTIGGLLFQPKVNNQGPRVTDLSVQSSAYGQVVPIVYGSYKVAGNVIFSTLLREVATTEDVGKGGPKVTNTTYTYNVDIAIALCGNEIDAIRKVYNNGKLIYDDSTGASLEAILASDLKAFDVRLYKGTETQLPDPSIEAELGVGNVPAYRGTAYIVFERLDCPGGQIPQLSFEVLETATESKQVVAGLAQTLNGSGSTLVNGIQPLTWVSRTTQPTIIFTELIDPITPLNYRFRNDAVGFNYGAPLATGPDSGIRYQNTGVNGILDEPFQLCINIQVSGLTNGFVDAFDQNGEYFQSYETAQLNVTSGTADRIAKHGNNLVIAVGRSDLANATAYLLFDWVSGAFVEVFFHTLLNRDLVVTSTYVWVVYHSGSVRRVKLLSLIDMTEVDDFALTGDLANTAISIKTAPLQNGNIAMVARTSSGNVFTLYQVDDSGTVTQTARDSSAGANAAYISALLSPSNAIGVSGKNVYGVLYGGLGGTSTYTVQPFVYRLGAVDASGAGLDRIILDVADRAGIDASLIDVSEVTETVDGYALTGFASARTNLEPLMTAFLIDPLKSDGQVKFRPREGLTSVASISFDELAAAPDLQGDRNPFPLSRVLEDELPRSKAIAFINKLDDYQVGTEVARRIITKSIRDDSEQLAVVMNSDRAASIANVLLYNDWAERNRRNLSVTREFAAVDAGDVVEIEYPRGTWAKYRTLRATDNGQICTFEAVEFDGQVSGASVPGAPTAPQEVTALNAPARAQILDIPILRDEDDNEGAYFAVNALGGTFDNAVLFLGQDDSTLAARANFSSPTIAGVADTKLGAWASGLIDELNTVNVTISGGDLFNATHEQVLSTTMNAALLGNEIIQFKTRTSLGSNKYRLSGLLRGLRGTEAARATHTLGERFVLLELGRLARPSYDLSEWGATRRTKAVVTGQRFSDVSSTVAINTGEGKKPLSPVNLRKTLVAGNTVFTWDRRTRLSENWLLGTIPLGEASQVYDVLITNLAGTVVLFSNTVTTASWTHPTSPTNLTNAIVTVWQVSATYGRGSPVTITV